MARWGPDIAFWEDDAASLRRDNVSDFNDDNILPLPMEDLERVMEWLQSTVCEGDGSELAKHLIA